MKALANFWLTVVCIVASALVWASLSEQIQQVSTHLKPLQKIEVGVDQVALALQEVKDEGPKQADAIEAELKKQEDVLEISLNNIRLYMIDRDAKQDERKPVTIEVHDQPWTAPRPGSVQQHRARARAHVVTHHATPWDDFPCDEACLRNAVRGDWHG